VEFQTEQVPRGEAAARRIIQRTGTLIVDGIGVGLVACGLVNPLLAAFIYVAYELTFILNSTRLLPGPAGQRHVVGPFPNRA
jgi:cation transport ATPase